jgi:secreted PhoX family phosphatase
MQAADGALSLASYQPVAPPEGVWIPCAASRSPWLTHLGSEEYEPDARCVETGTCGQDGKLGLQAPNLWFGKAGVAKVYDYGLVPEVTLLAGGGVQVVKHRALGRLSREHVTVAPDMRTVYTGDDGSFTALVMFVADQPGQLDAGHLYAAKWVQGSAAGGGSAKLQWLHLGHASDAELAPMAKSLTFSQIFATSNGPKVGLQDITTAQGHGWLQVKPGMEKAAAFLETRRYAALLGATTEFNKMEGTALSPQDHWLFVAVSVVANGMLKGGNPVDHMHLPLLANGAVYRCTLQGGQNDAGGQPIDSAWVATDMTAVITGTDLAGPDAWGNVASEDTVSGPDNLAWAPAWRTLFIGEDTSRHASNFLWAYHADTGKLARLMAVPEGAEVTGRFPFASTAS